MPCNTHEGNKFEFHKICLEDNKEKIGLSLPVDYKLTLDSDVKQICRRSWSNGLLVRVLDSQSRHLRFKTTTWLQF